MGKSLTKTNFDYSLVDKDAESKLIWFAAEIRRTKEAHAQSGLDMGRMLSEARELCGSKGFPSWVAAECGYSVATAYNYISAHDQFGAIPTVGMIELSAMYALTKSEPAKKKALGLAAKGIAVTQAMAKKFVKALKAPKAPKSPPKPSGDDSTDSTDEVIEVAVTDVEAPGTGICPCCGKDKWENEDGDGFACVSCRHPWGEPVGDRDEKLFRTQRSKLVKTAEAGQRAVDDLNRISPGEDYKEAVQLTRRLVEIGKGWK